jgi:hypothetical protein
VDPATVKPGMQCTLSDGSLVEIQQAVGDNVHFKVKYIDSLDNPEIPVGSTGQIPFEELIGEYQGTHAEGLT